MEVLVLLAAIAAGVGAARRPVWWLVPVGIGVVAAIRLDAGNPSDDPGDQRIVAVLVVVSYLGAAAFGWLAARAVQRSRTAQRPSPPG